MNLLDLEIKTVFNLSFSSNTILSCFFFFFFIIDLNFLIPAIMAQMFHPTAELVIPILISSNEANAETETQPVTVEERISKFST